MQEPELPKPPTPQDVPATKPADLPVLQKADYRSIPKTLKSFGRALFWFCWDAFWKIFHLESAGDKVKEHSPNLNKSRAGFIIVLAVTAFLGGCVEFRIQKDANSNLKIQLSDAQETIRQLREFNAGRPHKETAAELMGFHDETNFVSITNQAWSTNQQRVLTINSQGNTFVIPRPIFPPLTFAEMEDIKSKLVLKTNISIRIGTTTNDPLAQAFARQIGDIFLVAGFKVFSGTSPYLPPGVSIFAKRPLTSDLTNAILQLYWDINERPNWQFIPSTITNIEETGVYIGVRTPTETEIEAQFFGDPSTHHAP